MRRAAAGFLAVLVLAAAPAAQGQQPGASPLHLLDVPYVSQDELLCGGAAAAMLMRAAGARGVYAADFQALVDESASGIRTSVLAQAFRDRGYAVRTASGTGADVRRELESARPVLALIEDRPGRYHYVVIVGWSQQAVVFHDPARAPFVARSPEAFDRAWARAGRWMLAVEAVPRMDQRTDTTAPASRSPGLEAATRAFVEQRYADAARLADQAAHGAPADREAWRLLGASRYLLDDPGGALDAWNRAGDPRIDLVTIEGLRRTPHRAVERLIGLEPGEVLTREQLVRARRRLALLPSQQAAQVSYVALPGNLVEVRGAIVERPVVPSRLEWVVEGARVPISREVTASLSNLAQAGDRLTVAWRFWERRPRAGLDFQFPARTVGGTWGLAADWQREHYTSGPPAERRGARFTWTNWATARTRASAGVGLTRWADRGTAALVDAAAEVRPLSDRFALEVGVTTAAGGGESFATVSGIARWRAPAGSARIFGTGAVVHASEHAPRDLWPGAGAGHARPLLLRAHPLLDDGAVGGPVFGRTVVQGTFEAHRDVYARGFFTLAVAAFTDAARAWSRQIAGPSPLHVDVGAGLRIRLATGHPSIRIDVARGLRDGETALTAGWELAWLTRRQ